MTEHVLAWRPVEPLPPINGEMQKVLETVDTLREAWETSLSYVSRGEFEEARRRGLRRHAIETGIIERLYDVDWGVTQALVAEGITRSAAVREGGISEDTLATINAQLDALDLMVEAVGDGRPLTLSLIRELHAAITRTQRTYEARDQFGRLFARPMIHGDWKQDRNDVMREDGSLLEFVPPEHTESEMESLLAGYEGAGGAHPVVRAAWLHHRFVRIHPFQDGNGRVARALTLLVLLRSRYAPLVVDRNQRNTYIEALDAANEGDLRPLVRLFAGLEIVALKSELSPQLSSASQATGAVAVAREMVGRFQERKRADDQDRRAASEKLAQAAHAQIIGEVERLGQQLEHEFRSVDRRARRHVSHGAPGASNARHWHGQLVYVAKRIDFYANLADGSWWTCLHLTALGQVLRYIVAIQKVGHTDLGVLAVTPFAEVVEDKPGRRTERDPGSPPEHRRAFEPTAGDSVTLVHTNSPNDRWPEIAELIDRTLAVGVRYFLDELG